MNLLLIHLLIRLVFTALVVSVILAPSSVFIGETEFERSMAKITTAIFFGVLEITALL